LGELAFLHQAVDVRALEAGLGFDLSAAQDAVLGRRRRGGGLRRHESHSLTLSGVDWRNSNLERRVEERHRKCGIRDRRYGLASLRESCAANCAEPVRTWPAGCAR